MIPETATTTPIGAHLPAFAPEQPEISPPATDIEDRERRRAEASAEMLRTQRRTDNRIRWENACPPVLQYTDWTHAGLTPYRLQLDQIRGYQPGTKGLIASGPTGRGKSRAMWELMRRLGDDGLDVRCYSANDWFSTLGDYHRYGRDDCRGWVETVARRHIVFLDDYGQQAMRKAREDWAQGWFFHFLDIRLGAGLPLFLTTNLRSADMIEQNGNIRGDPLVRRLLAVANPVSFW